MGFMRDDHYSFSEPSYNYSDGRWWFMMSGTRRLSDLVERLKCISGRSEYYSADAMWLKPEYTHSYSARRLTMEYIEGMVDLVLNHAYPVAACIVEFVESIDFDEVDDQGYDYVDYDNGTWEGDDRDFDEPPY